MTDTNNNLIGANNAQFVSVGGPLDRVKVTLRIFGEELDPDEISSALMCEPSGKTKKGEIVAEDGKGNRRISPFGSWRLQSTESEHVDLEEQVLKLLSRVVADPDVWRKLTHQYKVDLFCGLFLNEGCVNRGFSLSAKVMKELAKRNLEIGFDIYAV